MVPVWSSLTGQEALLAWSVDSGNYDGVDLSGLKVAVAVKAAGTLGFGGGLVIHPDPIKAVVLVDERAEPPAVMDDRMCLKLSWLVAEPEADEVGHDQAEALPLKTHRDFAVEKTPSRVAVNHQHRQTTPGFHDVHVQTVANANAIARERNLLRDPRRQGGRRQFLHAGEGNASPGEGET